MTTCSEFLSLFDRFHEQNEVILNCGVGGECEDISIGDDMFARKDISLTPSIPSLVQEWQQLDAEYLVEFNRVNGTGKRTSLAIPYSFNVSTEPADNVDFEEMEHERIPHTVKTEYLTKLTNLLRKVPKEYQNDTTNILHCAQYPDKNILHDLHLLTELRPPFEKHNRAVKTEPVDQTAALPIIADDVVLSFTLYAADSRTTQPKQSLELLGSQRLCDLQRALYCVNNTLCVDDSDSYRGSGSGNTLGGTTSTSSSGASKRHRVGVHQCDANAFFCIEGQVYAQLCIPHTTTTGTGGTTGTASTSIDSTTSLCRCVPFDATGSGNSNITDGGSSGTSNNSNSASCTSSTSSGSASNTSGGSSGGVAEPRTAWPTLAFTTSGSNSDATNTAATLAATANTVNNNTHHTTHDAHSVHSNSTTTIHHRPTTTATTTVATAATAQEPLRAVLWLYKSLFDVQLSSETAPHSVESSGGYPSGSSGSGIVGGSGGVGISSCIGTSSSVGISSIGGGNTHTDEEHILFIAADTTTVSGHTADKPKRGRKPKHTADTTTANTTTPTIANTSVTIVANADDINPTAPSAKPTARALGVNKRTQKAITEADLLPHRESAAGKKRSASSIASVGVGVGSAVDTHTAFTITNAHTTATFTTTDTSIAPRGRRKKAPVQEVSLFLPAPTTLTTTHTTHTTLYSDEQNNALRHHVFDFDTLRAQICTGARSIALRCANDARLSSVQWQFGVPYVYTHASGCEHVLYLTNVRTYSAKYDAGAAYPAETYRARARQRRCGVCDVLPAVCVVYEDRLADTSPCHFCEHCYHMLHYSAQGQLLYDDFHVFPYTHDP